MTSRLISYSGFLTHAVLAIMFTWLLFYPKSAAAQPPITVLLKDIADPSTTFPTASSNPHHFMAAHDKLYFVTEIDARFALWVTDGSAANTQFVVDFPQFGNEPRTVEPEELIPVGNHLFYLLPDGLNLVLWRTDGAPAGTQKITYTGNLHGKPVAIENTLYFVTRNNAGSILWKVDTIQTQATQVKQFALSTHDFGEASNLSNLNGQLVFTYNADELWVSDGTADGTQRLTRIGDAEDTRLHDLTVVANKIYFMHATAAGGPTGLWVSDATEAGTMRLPAGLPTARFPLAVITSYMLTPFNDLVYFIAEGQFELPYVWRTDGTVEGTFEVFQITIDGVLVRPVTLAASAQALYFLAEYDQPTPPWQLWQSDGSEAGSLLIDPEAAALEAAAGDTACFTNVQDKLICLDEVGQKVTLDSAFGLDFNTYQSPGALITFFKGKFYFGGHDDIAGLELKSYDPQSKQIALVKDLNRTRLEAEGLTSDSSPGNLISAGDYLYFTADNVLGVRQLWRTVGTVKEKIRVGSQSFSSINALIAISETLYFTGRSLGQTDGMTLWKTDASGVNIEELVTLDFGEITYLAVMKDKLYFSTTNSEFQGLWQSDGTPQGTTLLQSFAFPAVAPKELTALNDKLYFIGESVAERQQLWISDGTVEGTKSLKELAPLSQRTRVKNLTVMNDHLYFLAATVSRPECSGGDGEINELWRSDGTTEGTVMLINFDCATEAEWPFALTALENHLYFMMRPLWPTSSFYTLWRSDVNATNLELILDGQPPFYSLPDDVQRLKIESVNGTDFFYAPSTINPGGTALWEVRGSEAVHVAFDPDVPENGYTTSGGLARFQNSLFFSSHTPGAGVELMLLTPGQPCCHIIDVNPGPETSLPSQLLVHKNMLFFTADNGRLGNELWVYKSCEPSTCKPTFLPVAMR